VPLKKYVRPPEKPFSTWGNSGIEPDKGTGNQLSRKL
jgi:hypothetical protein